LKALEIEGDMFGMFVDTFVVSNMKLLFIEYGRNRVSAVAGFVMNERSFRVIETVWFLARLRELVNS
jgi:hypothetical protein